MYSTTDQMNQVVSSGSASPQRSGVSEMIEDHLDYLFRYAFSRMHDEASAEDVVQETLLAALRGNCSFAQRSSPRTWLTGILKHKMIDHLRHTSRQVQFYSDVDIEGDSFFGENGDWQPGASPLPWENTSESLFERKEFMTVLEECISKLPRNLAVAFSLREIEGLDSSEICEILNISTSNLSVIMHRARLRLRRLLEERWFAATRDQRRDLAAGRVTLSVANVV